MNEADFWKCPNCGSTSFTEVASGGQRCAYCGTVRTFPEAVPPEAAPSQEAAETVTCHRCGFENRQGSRYCNNCGAQLTGLAALVEQLKSDPAAVSILASVLGLLFFPGLGGIVGLVLAYRALRQARAGVAGSERMARIAILVGWGGIALGALPLCLAVTWSGAQMGFSLCETTFQQLLALLSGAG